MSEFFSTGNVCRSPYNGGISHSNFEKRRDNVFSYLRVTQMELARTHTHTTNEQTNEQLNGIDGCEREAHREQWRSKYTQYIAKSGYRYEVPYTATILHLLAGNSVVRFFGRFCERNLPQADDTDTHIKQLSTKRKQQIANSGKSFFISVLGFFR